MVEKVGYNPEDAERASKEKLLTDFKAKCHEMMLLFREIQNIDLQQHSSLYKELVINPVNEWKRNLGPKEAEKSQFLHALINSYSEWEKSPDLDLEGGLVESYLDDVIMPRLEEELSRLRKESKKTNRSIAFLRKRNLNQPN